ncbi:MAG: DUF3383 domain-containing protein [Acidobacteriia bacterium]|nr:DUF3383 domain-containing protein [Terriglobia bacterium]
MTTNVLPVSNVINVTITTTPSGLTEKNVNSLALFTQDQPLNLEQFGIYISAAQVASNYGTNSKTAQMANAVFSQVPNVLSGNGRLVIVPMLGAVSATHGNVQTPNISANLSSIIAVTNGNLRVTIDGVVTNVGNLNFTNCVTWSDVAAVLQAGIQDALVTALTNGLQFTSKKVGTSSTVALGTYAGGGTDLSGAGYLNAAGETATAGANSSGETVLQCLARTSGLVGYVPIMSTLDLEDAAIVAVATGIQAQDNMFFQHCASTQDILGVCTTIAQSADTKTRMLLYTPSLHDANLFKAAYAGRACSVDFTGSNTSQTMNLKQLATITPDTGISETFYIEAQTAGCDLYVSYDGVPSVVSNGGNDFFDNPYSDLALKFYLETAGFNYLRQTNTKVPQTEPGMNGLKDAYRKICNQFVINGEIAPGAWNSSETFGDPALFNKNIMNTGFYIYSQPVAQQNSVDREARKAPLVQIAIKRAGAIHSGNVIVLVNS